MGTSLRTSTDRRPNRGGGYRRVLLATALAGAAVLSGCVRPTGDFERAKPSVVHDALMPAAGEQSARYRGDPVSKFNYTNDEKLLRDRGWTLIRPPWAQDWIGGTVVELSRTRILPEVEGRVPIDLYYIYLSSDKFRSSDARYDRITSDANGDAELVLPFCEVATRVRAADDERLRVLETKQLTTEEVYEGAKARVWENRVMIKWVSQALRYRVKAYQSALDKLEIETPTQNRVWQTTTAIRKLDAQVRIAEAGCETQVEVVQESELPRSRIFKNWSRERPPVQK